MTTRSITIRRESWRLTKPFAISRGTKNAAEVIVCEVNDGVASGRGECVPYARYGETPGSVESALNGIADALAAGATIDVLQTLLPPGAARNAADCALWDLRAKQTGTAVWQTAGLAAPRDTLTAYTISLGTPSDMGSDAYDARDRPLLKLKLGSQDPVDCVEAVRRGAPDARLIADANEGWSVRQLKDIATALAELGVELVEQPVPADDEAELADWRSPILLCADESFHTSADIRAVAGRYGAVNIKLDKAGGLTEAITCLRAAQTAQLKIMVGCMVATSLAMAPAALLAASADYVDLDGPLLLAEDRPGGIEFLPGSLMKPPPRSLWG